MKSSLFDRTALVTAVLLVLSLGACSKKSDGPPPGMPSGYGNEVQNNSAPGDLDSWEKRDLGVKPQDTLHDGGAHGPTPMAIPGGKVITTRELIALQQSAGQKLVLLEVLGAPQTLPNAFRAAPAAAPGNFKDQTQQQFAQVLQQLTKGDTNAPIVTYCASPECWMSYNAALRAINAGYRNVMWYRGGLEAWQRSGQPLSGGQPPIQGPAQGPMPQENPGQQPSFPPPNAGGNYPQQPYPQQPYPQPQPGNQEPQGGFPQQQQQQQGFPPQN
jgi:PQQ-dependent catabolism-associated CXXCW motif protein